MNLKPFLLTTLLLILSTSSIECSDFEHDSDPEHSDPANVDHAEDFHHDSQHHETDSEPHEFDHDPHKLDADYDEDLVTGTSHHSKRTKKQMKTEIDEIFKHADKNNDTKIDKDELTLFIIDNMKKLHSETAEYDLKTLDKNGDNKLSLDEYLLYHHEKTGEALDNFFRTDNSSTTKDLEKKVNHERIRFKAADNDADGFLNLQEYLLMRYPVYYPHMAHTIVNEYIEDLDTNNDGMVDKNEYVTHFHDNEDKKHTEEEIKKKNEESFDKYDKDKNGKIDPEEYYAILKPGYDAPAKDEVDHLFKESDTNKDGVITMDEIESHAHLWIGGEPLEEEGEYSHHYDDEL